MTSAHEGAREQQVAGEAPGAEEGDHGGLRPCPEASTQEEATREAPKTGARIQGLTQKGKNKVWKTRATGQREGSSEDRRAGALRTQTIDQPTPKDPYKPPPMKEFEMSRLQGKHLEQKIELERSRLQGKHMEQRSEAMEA